MHPDDEVYRRRALAARVATLAPAVDRAIAGCMDLHAPIPPEAYDMPAIFQRWADQIERTQP